MTKLFFEDQIKSDKLRERILSLSVALCALLVFLPIGLGLFLYLTYKHKGSPFFAHDRVGFGGRIFKCYKFRTMRIDAAQRLDELLERDVDAREEWRLTQKLKNDPRIVGRFCEFLRKTGLDELPQIFNILRGDMEVVGPRPITIDELPRYGKDVHYYMSVRPGLTGNWQVSGRNDISYEERVSLDVDYIQNANMLTDLTIIFKTAGQLMMRAGY